MQRSVRKDSADLAIVLVPNEPEGCIRRMRLHYEDKLEKNVQKYVSTLCNDAVIQNKLRPV